MLPSLLCIPLEVGDSWFTWTTLSVPQLSSGAAQQSVSQR